MSMEKEKNADVGQGIWVSEFSVGPFQDFEIEGSGRWATNMKEDIKSAWGSLLG